MADRFETATQSPPPSAEKADIFEHLHGDHEHLLGCLRQLGTHSRSGQHPDFEELKAEIDAHVKTEEELLFPSLANGAGALVAEARRQHATITASLEALSHFTGALSTWSTQLADFVATVERHFAYEESRLFVAARRLLSPEQAQQLLEQIAASEADKKALAAEPHVLAEQKAEES